MMLWDVRLCAGEVVARGNPVSAGKHTTIKRRHSFSHGQRYRVKKAAYVSGLDELLTTPDKQL